LRGGRMVRETLWGEVEGTFNVFPSAAGAAILNVTGGGLLALRPWTIVRARGIMFIESDQSAASEQQSMTIGHCVVSDQAVAIGITAVPTPNTDGDSDLWYVYQSLMTAQGAGTVDSQLGIAVEYDSRAMRKVEDGAQLIVVAESDNAALTDGLNLRHRGRILIKLH